MKDVLTYSLRKFPSPVVTADGNLVKTSKAKLMHEIEKRVENPDVEFISADNALLLDGMALIQTIKHIPESFGAFVEVMLKRILSLASNARSKRVDFVSDVYPDVSIKNIERSKRAGNGSTVIRILSPEQKVPRQFKKFLSVGKNKEALIEFFCQHLKNVRNLSNLIYLFPTLRFVINSAQTAESCILKNALSYTVIMKKRTRGYCFMLSMLHQVITI